MIQRNPKIVRQIRTFSSFYRGWVGWDHLISKSRPGSKQMRAHFSVGIGLDLASVLIVQRRLLPAL
jgi:hypothetical protein